jgi:hypothetical protein
MPLDKISVFNNKLIGLQLVLNATRSTGNVVNRLAQYWKHIQLAALQVHTTVTMRSMILWVVTPCSSERDRRFRGTYVLYLQGRNVAQARHRQKRAISCLLKRILPRESNKVNVISTNLSTQISHWRMALSKTFQNSVQKIHGCRLRNRCFCLTLRGHWWLYYQKSKQPHVQTERIELIWTYKILGDFDVMRMELE